MRAPNKRESEVMLLVVVPGGRDQSDTVVRLVRDGLGGVRRREGEGVGNGGIPAVGLFEALTALANVRLLSKSSSRW